jgi:protein-tyrosine phosphatase
MAAAVEEVQLTSVVDGGLVVTWHAGADCEYVEIALGLSPMVSDHEVVAVAEGHRGRLRLDSGAGDWLYVSVRPVGGGISGTAGQRLLPLFGPRNFRDLGGYRTRYGHRTAWGRLFRSDTLSLNDEDLRVFGKLGIRAVWDFRTDTERRSSPNRLPQDDVRVVELPLIGERPDGLLDLEALADPDEFLRAAYLGMLQGAAPSLGTLFQGLCQPDGLPAVMHCGGGKDRTGLAAALVLSALGVGRNDVLDDYELTARFADPARVAEIAKRLDEERRLRPDLPVGVIQTSRWAMAETLETVDRKYGGIDNYLREVAGVPVEALEGLRARMLD